MNQGLFIANNSGAILLVLIIYILAYYYLCVVYNFNLKNQTYLPFSSSSFDEIPLIIDIH